MTILAYYATLSNTEGTALRTADGQVHFLAAATGLWQTLGNADAPRLQLLGRVDIADAQRLADGDLARIATSRQQMEV
jgi:hypothetical protein